MEVLVQKIVCLDSLNCIQVNAFFHSLRNCSFMFSLPYCCKLYLYLYSIFHFRVTTFVQWPFSAKTIQGFRQLICIINRLHKRATSKRKQNKCKNEQDGRGIQIPSSNKPGYLACWEMRLFRVVWLCGKDIF